MENKKPMSPHDVVIDNNKAPMYACGTKVVYTGKVYTVESYRQWENGYRLYQVGNNWHIRHADESELTFADEDDY